MKLEREAIIEAAIALLDEVGLDGLSMRRLAKDLDVHSFQHFSQVAESGAGDMITQGQFTQLDITGVIRKISSAALRRFRRGIFRWVM